MTVELPERLGRYKVEAVIGSGGFATVYRAHDERLDALVAIKVLAENHCLDPDMRERFLKEGRVLRRIGSPHVVTVHDLGETDRGQPYLVLDHADRGDLAARVAERRGVGQSAERRGADQSTWRVGPADLIAVAGALADALAAVHASGLVHRDVAPRNLLLRSVRAAGTEPRGDLLGADEQLLLADLGLSKDLAVASGLTVGGGTAGFTPPEQRSGLNRVDATADLWAASALVVWLLTGSPPDDEGRWYGRLTTAGWPPALAGTLARGLATDPADRHESAARWFHEVRDGVTPTARFDGPPPRAEPADPPPAEPSQPASTARRRLPLVAALALALGVLAGVTGTWIVGTLTAPSRESVEELPGGQVRARAADGDHHVAIVGPAEIAAGRTATFTAEAAGVGHTMWIAPDGVVHVDAAQLHVHTRTAGDATVTLIGTDAEGRRLIATHRLRVTGTS